MNKYLLKFKYCRCYLLKSHKSLSLDHLCTTETACDNVLWRGCINKYRLVKTTKFTPVCVKLSAQKARSVDVMYVKAPLLPNMLSLQGIYGK